MKRKYNWEKKKKIMEQFWIEKMITRLEFDLTFFNKKLE